jgi:hypothetical protein
MSLMFNDLPQPADTWLDTWYDVMVWMANQAGGHQLLDFFGGSLVVALVCLMTVAGGLLYGAWRAAQIQRYELAVGMTIFAREVLCTAGWLTALSASDRLPPSQVGMIAVPMILPVVALSVAISRQIDRRKRFAAAPK